MGEIIVRNSLPKADLLRESETEGMLLALSYSIQLRPDKDDLVILNQIARHATQLYTKYIILVGFDTLARNGYINKDQVQEIYSSIKAFRKNADNPLLTKIDETVNILGFIDPETKK